MKTTEPNLWGIFCHYLDYFFLINAIWLFLFVRYVVLLFSQFGLPLYYFGLVFAYYLRQRRTYTCFSRVRLSVCLLARLLKNGCIDLDEMLRVDRCRGMDELINF